VRIDYDYEHRCAEHEHDPVSLSVIFRVIPWPPPRANPILKNLRALRDFVLNLRALKNQQAPTDSHAIHY
jgi:hypothetical protein